MEKLTLVQNQISQFVKKDVPFDMIKNHILLLVSNYLHAIYLYMDSYVFSEELRPIRSSQ